MSKQSVINVKITADNEIEYVDVDYSNEDGDSGSDCETMEKELIIEEEIEPELIPTGTDSMMIKMKNAEETIVEHVCGKCNEGFYSIDELKRHLNLCRNLPKDIIDTKENIDIEIKFAELENFTSQQCFCCLEELTSAHNGHIKCNFCPKSFKSHINLERHLFILHSSNSAYACAYCNVTCPTQKMYDLHIATHVNGKPFACHKCGKDFTRKYHLDRHRLYTKCDSSQPKSQLPCKVCGKVFSRIDNLREHLRGHIGQGTRRRDYQCPYCEKSFYGSSLLNIHIRTHTGEKPFPCDLCTKTFPSNGALRKHRRMHTGEKPYSCKECAKCFSAKETLNRHMKIHTGDRPHICEYCNKKFIQATQLRAHLFHHTGEHGFHCSICGQMFNRKTRLESHIKMVHINSAKYTCDICNAQFRRKTDLVKHCDKHNKTIRKYLHCNACEKFYSTKAALQVHLRSHENSEEWQCQLCKRTFKKNEALMRHMKNKHKDAFDEKETQEIVENYIINDIKNEHYDDINIEHMIIPKTEDSLGNNYDILGTYEVKPSIDNKINNNTNNNNINDNYNNNNNNINENNNNDNNNNYDKKKIYNNDNNNRTDNSNNDNNINIINNNNNNNNKNKNKYKITKKKKIIKAKVEEETPFLSDARLKESIGKLLNLLVDESTLKNFGWPKTPVEEVLSRVIKQCGQMPADYNNSQDHTRKMRENAKLLFTTVIENDAIKAMLNNNTVDEVIMHVLKLADKK